MGAACGVSGTGEALRGGGRLCGGMMATEQGAQAGRSGGWIDGRRGRKAGDGVEKNGKRVKGIRVRSV